MCCNAREKFDVKYCKVSPSVKIFGVDEAWPKSVKIVE
jgi:hypothetical protein